MNGKEPPTLMKVSASMLVAIAMCGSMPRLIIAGTVMIEVLPVTTLITLVKKKIAIRAISCGVDIRLGFPVLGSLLCRWTFAQENAISRLQANCCRIRYCPRQVTQRLAQTVHHGPICEREQIPDPYDRVSAASELARCPFWVSAWPT